MTNFEAEATSQNTPPERLRELANLDNSLKLLIASNPATPVDVLIKLAKSSDRALGAPFHDRPTLKAIVANPNTPTEVLMALGKEFPFELLENCVFNLLLLENPNFISEMPADTLQALLLLPTVPAYIINLAAKRDDGNISLALVNNPHTSKAILEKLVESKHKEIVEAAQLHVNWAGEANAEEAREASEVLSPFLTDPRFGTTFEEDMILDRLKMIPPFLIGCTSKTYLDWRIEQPGFWENDWQVLSQGAFSLNLRISLAANSRTPVEILETLAKDLDKSVRYCVARNPNIPIEVLTTLAKDLDKSVRYGVAQNPNTPIEVFTTLPTRLDKDIRRALAQNSNMPAGVFAILLRQRQKYKPNTVKVSKSLAKDSDKQVRHEVARNPHTPAEVLKTLARDSDRQVRHEVAKNPNTPQEVLESLATDRDSGVRHLIAKNPNTPVEVIAIAIKYSGDLNLHWLTINDHRTIPVLKILAQDSDLRVRTRIAQSRHTPREVLATLATDYHAQVRCRIAQNHHTPVEVLTTLAKDGDQGVRARVAHNRSSPVELLVTLAQDSDIEVLRGVAQNCQTPVELLESLVKYSESNHRCKLAKDPQTPASLIEILATDSDIWVRRFVAMNYRTPDYLAVLALLNLPESEKTAMIAAAKSNNQYVYRHIIDIVSKKCLRDSFARLVVLLHPQTTGEILADYHQSIKWMDRYGCAINPNTPDDCLKTLAEDANRFVRAAAKWNLARRRF